MKPLLYLMPLQDSSYPWPLQEDKGDLEPKEHWGQKRVQELQSGAGEAESHGVRDGVHLQLLRFWEKGG